MALGVPPIFVDEGGYRETVVDGSNGRLIERGNLDSWKDALAQATDPATRSAWTEAGLARIEELGLTPNNHARRLALRIDSLL